MIVCFILSLSLVLYSVFISIVINPGLFLFSGGLFMMACWILAGKIIGHKSNAASAISDIKKLSFKNASRNIKRSMSILILLSLGVFVVMITGANRKTFLGIENKNQSGTGGYSLWVETTVAVENDLNTSSGRKKSGIVNDTIFKNIEITQFLLKKGDDASCLNLNHVEKPGIIGINPDLFNNRNSVIIFIIFMFPYVLLGIIPIFLI